MKNLNSKKAKNLLRWFLFFNFIAILTTIYLTMLHYESSLTAPCSINSFFDCGAVNKSSYSSLFGIPVSILGLLNYIFLFFVGTGLLTGLKFKKIHKALSTKNVINFLFSVITFGVAFSLYLTYAELFLIRAVCLFCLAQQIIIIIDLFLVWRLKKQIN